MRGWSMVRAWSLPLAAYALALALRLALLDTPVFGDEAAHYFVSRRLGAPPENLLPANEYTRVLFWQRPAFSLLLWPGTLAGFDGYRIWHAALASLAPLLGWLLLRRIGTPLPLRLAAVLALTALPPLVPWGTIVFPDALLATALLAAGVAWVHERPAAALALLVVASWIKEVAWAFLLAGLLVALWRGIRAGRIRLYPLQLDQPATAWAFAGALAVAPMAYALMMLDGRITGWSTSPFTAPDLLLMAGTLPLLLVLLAGLARPRTRTLAAGGLVMPVFFIAYAALGRGVDTWYTVAPTTLAIVAAAGVAGRLMPATLLAPTGRPDPAEASSGRSPPGHARERPPALLSSWLPLARLPPRAQAWALLLVVASPLGLAVLPAGHAARAAWVPGDPGESLAEQQERLLFPDPLDAVLDVVAPNETVLLGDLGWFYSLHPFALRQPALGWGYTETATLPAEWTHAMGETDATVLHKTENPLNRALRHVHADCMRLETDVYVVLDNAACGDRTEALAEARDAAVNGTLGA